MNALDRVIAGISDRLRERVPSKGGEQMVTREDGTRWLVITAPKLLDGRRVQFWLPDNGREPYPGAEVNAENDAPARNAMQPRMRT